MDFPSSLGRIMENSERRANSLQRAVVAKLRTQTDVDRTLDELLHDDEARRKAGEISGAYIRENAGAADIVYQAALLPESH